MASTEVMAALDGMIARLKAAPWQDREAIKNEILALGLANNSGDFKSHLDQVRKDLPLELRWEIDEVLDAMAPPPAPPPEPEVPPEPEPPADGKLRMSDLREVYADQRGTAVFTDKTGKRWFLQQVHPMSGQPMMMELSPAEVQQVKDQLRGSPYWRLGAGA